MNATEPANKGKSYAQQVLTRQEVQKLLAACCHTSTTGIRARAMLALMYRSGLRSEELLSLRPHDLNRAAGTVRVMRGKGGKPRTIGVDPMAFDVVALWTAHRATLSPPSGAPLFCTRHGGRLYGGNLRHLTARLGKRAGLTKRVHPHAFRYTHAAELAQEGVPMNVIQDQLGHSSLNTTSIYLKNLAPQDVIDRIRGRQWDPGRSQPQSAAVGRTTIP